MDPATSEVCLEYRGRLVRIPRWYCETTSEGLRVHRRGVQGMPRRNRASTTEVWRRRILRVPDPGLAAGEGRLDPCVLPPLRGDLVVDPAELRGGVGFDQRTFRLAGAPREACAARSGARRGGALRAAPRSRAHGWKQKPLGAGLMCGSPSSDRKGTTSPDGQLSVATCQTSPTSRGTSDISNTSHPVM